MGYEIPEDVSIVGCDNMPFTESVWPRLTTLAFPVQDMSQIVCDIVMKRLLKAEDQPVQINDISHGPNIGYSGVDRSGKALAHRYSEI